MKKTAKNLSPRELEVLHHLARATATPAIGKKLDISEKTVCAHIQNILRKMGMNSRLQVVVWAYKSQLVRP